LHIFRHANKYANEPETTPETILKRFRFVSVFCFCFISHVTTSEIKLKQNCFVSVLFQFYFRCNHCLREDAIGDSEDGEDDELPCVIGESEGDCI